MGLRRESRRTALRALPSHGHHEYVFPAKANPRFRGNFKRPHAWDLGKLFRRVAEAAGIHQLRIHDLRHFTASTLTSAGVTHGSVRGLGPWASFPVSLHIRTSARIQEGTV
jgi:integrase